MVTLIQMRNAEQDPVKRVVISKLIEYERAFQYLPIETVNGLTLPYDKVVDYPGVAFRKLNAPLVSTPGVYQSDVEKLFPFGGETGVDVAIARNYPNKAVREFNGLMRRMAEKFWFSFWYANSPRLTAYAEADGFDGVQARVLDGSSQFIDAGATSGTDGSTIFFVEFAEDMCTGLMTEGGFHPRNLGETPVKGAVPEMLSRCDAEGGMAIYHGRAVAMLSNINAANPPTPELMDQALDATKSGRARIFMSRRSHRLLKQECWKKNIVLGTMLDELGNPIDRWGPASPIIVTESVVDTETNS